MKKKYDHLTVGFGLTLLIFIFVSLLVLLIDYNARQKFAFNCFETIRRKQTKKFPTLIFPGTKKVLKQKGQYQLIISYLKDLGVTINQSDKDISKWDIEIQSIDDFIPLEYEFGYKIADEEFPKPDYIITYTSKGKISFKLYGKKFKGKYYLVFPITEEIQ